MDDKLTIPQKIKVGFQERKDTYTGKLAYVVYIDSKGVLRKEKSWEGWRDKKIDPIEYDNIPKDGFVLNKDVGGTRRSYGWDSRVEKVRVFDKDGFEFEISIPNLLFILQECSAIKGKGLEGEFVYAWSGPELVLLPVSCEEYKKSVEHCVLQEQKITAKDMLTGCTYFTKDHENVMYLGKEMWFEEKSGGRKNDYRTECIGKKRHVFVKTDRPLQDGKDRTRYDYWIQDGFVKLAKKTSDTPVPQFAEEYEAFKKTIYHTPPSNLFVKEIHNFKKYDYSRSGSYCVVENGVNYMVRVDDSYPYEYDAQNNRINGKYDIHYVKTLEVKNGKFVEARLNYLQNPKYNSWANRNYEDQYIIDKASRKGISEAEIKSVVKELWVECENGSKYRIGSF